MWRRLASVVFVLDSVVIGLGAIGHGLQASHLHAAIDQFPIEPDMHSMLYVVWYSVSGCMLTFGVTLIWVWRRVQTGDGRPMFAANAIGVLYSGIGAFGLVYRNGDPFMGFFLALGALLLASGYVLTRPRQASGKMATRTNAAAGVES